MVYLFIDCIAILKNERIHTSFLFPFHIFIYLLIYFKIIAAATRFITVNVFSDKGKICVFVMWNIILRKIYLVPLSIKMLILRTKF